MSGLDKFMKVPSKSPKKVGSKDKEKNEKSKSLTKRAVQPESSESSEEIASTDSEPLHLEAEESEKTTEFQDLIPDDSVGQQDLESSPESYSHSHKFAKFQLKCTNKKCNYQRILMKSSLSSNDQTCPKCGSQMRQK